MNKTTLSVLCALILSGCVTSSVLRDRAMDAWEQGRYAQAVDLGLDAYKKALKQRGKKQSAEIQQSENFLIRYVPLANQYLKETAERQLGGTESERLRAWKTYEQLVQMNRQIRHSAAADFLPFENFEDDLTNAKNTAAEIYYSQAQELISQNTRNQYIQAFYILNDINDLIPNYKDSRNLMELCLQKATQHIAFSVNNLTFSTNDIREQSSITRTIVSRIQEHIESNDDPGFLEYQTADHFDQAVSNAADLYIELSGYFNFSSDISSRYYTDGSVTWIRELNTPLRMSVTRLSDNRTESAEASMNLDQEIQLEFYPKKYDTLSLTEKLFFERFNNKTWMDNQLYQVREAIENSDRRMSMVLWAEMQFENNISFLPTAQVLTSEGTTEMSVDPAVWEETQKFMDSDLEDFLSFSDISMNSLVRNDLIPQLFSHSGVRRMIRFQE